MEFVIARRSLGDPCFNVTSACRWIDGPPRFARGDDLLADSAEVNKNLMFYLPQINKT
jgi:hypothetical protein